MVESVLLVASTRDIASMNILKHLCELVEFEPTDYVFAGKEILFSKTLGAYLLVIDGELITADFLEALPNEFNRILFLSRHSSQSRLPSLLVHFPGNWTHDNSMGGKPKKLSIADPKLHKMLVTTLYRYKQDGMIPPEYEVGIEVTHHGPTIEKACTFIEIGSDVENWKDPRVGKIVAEVVVESLRNIGRIKETVAKIGFGGPHYAPKFLNMLLSKSDILLGHIAPKYVADDLEKRIIQEAIDKSLVPIDGALIDWKGLNSAQRSRIIALLEELGMEYVRV